MLKQRATLYTSAFLLFIGLTYVALIIGRAFADDDENMARGQDENGFETCEVDFLTTRRNENFYDDFDLEKKQCPQVTRRTERQTNTIPVYWAIVGPAWDEDRAKALMDESETWLKRYCIHLTAYPVNLRDPEKNVLQATLDDEDGNADAYAGAVRQEVYESIWEKHLGQPSGKFLLVLFVNQYNTVDYGSISVTVAGNFEKMPVILIPQNPDQQSRHIVTHELLHGLGKHWKGRRTVAFRGVAHKDNTWSEGPCRQDMGHPKRALPTNPLQNNITDLMDWASYYQMRERSETIY